ncbi:MAG: PhoH family protein [Rikenellaceae bacterium]
MLERIFTLKAIDPRDFYGDNNINITHIRNKSPKLKLTCRGAMIKIVGAESDIDNFEARLKDLLVYYKRYNNMSIDVIDQIFDTISPVKMKGITLKKDEEHLGDDKDVLVYGTGGNIIRAKSPNQRKLVDLYHKNDLLFAIGPAGSGKTYTAIALAVRALKNKSVKKIILTRPAVEAGEKLGFLPGDMKEKLDPYLQPLYDALHDMIPAKKLEEYLEEGIVQIAPLAYMRGRTLDNAFVILDEAQNATFAQLKMFLTRMGASAKFIVTGDTSQIDLPRKSDSGLIPAVEKLNNIKGIAVVELDSTDIVRHALVKEIVKAFNE